MFEQRNTDESLYMLRPLTPEETGLVRHVIPSGTPETLELRDAFTPANPGEAGELYGGSAGFLVRTAPFLLLWGGLSAGMVWCFGAQPWVFLGFALLTAVTFWCFRQQDYRHSPAGERSHARSKLAGLKAKEMAGELALRREVVKSYTRRS